MTGMDALTGTFRLSCPRHGAARVLLSSFHCIARLPGATHPAVYRIEFDCTCGAEHPALLTEAELDWSPLGLSSEMTFLNLMTAREDGLAGELGAIVSARIKAGEWPWSFYCRREERARPVTPSAFALLAAGGAAMALAIRCPWCDAVSINVVSRAHVDLPFVNDASVAVAPRVFAAGDLATLEAFHAALHSAAFDERRLELEP